jgi:hypothetical protein
VPDPPKRRPARPGGNIGDDHADLAAMVIVLPNRSVNRDLHFPISAGVTGTSALYRSAAQSLSLSPVHREP